MAFLKHANNAVSSISNIGGISNSATAVSIQSGDTSLFPATGNFEITIWPAGTNATFANCEIALVTAGQGTGTFTITRAQEGTTAKSFNQGDNIGLLLTAKQLTDIENLLSGQSQGSVGYFDSNGQLNALAPGSSGQFLQTQGASANPVWASGSLGGGWNASPGTPTYASSTTITVPAGASSIYDIGDKIWIVASSSNYYFYVTAVSSTLLTVTGGSDYSVPNISFTSMSYSKVLTPNGFPQAFNYTPSFTGFSANPPFTAKFYITGRLVTFFIDAADSGLGTSNSTGFTISLPIPSGSTSLSSYAIGLGKDNTSSLVTAIIIVPGGGGTVATLTNGTISGNWTASGGKGVIFMAQYSI